jgi:hypothetical protein
MGTLDPKARRMIRLWRGKSEERGENEKEK